MKDVKRERNELVKKTSSSRDGVNMALGKNVLSFYFDQNPNKPYNEKDKRTQVSRTDASTDRKLIMKGLESEVWIPVSSLDLNLVKQGYTSSNYDYEVSSKGVIRNSATKSKATLKGTLHENRYRRVILQAKKNISAYACPILNHVLIALAFVHNPNPKLFTQVDHIDDDKLNNHPSNLRWTTPSKNKKKSAHLAKPKSSRLKANVVKSIFNKYYSIEVSIKELSRIYNCGENVVRDIVKGHTYKSVTGVK